MEPTHPGRTPGGRDAHAAGGRRWVRPLLLLAVVTLGVAVALEVGLPPVGAIQEWVSRAGWAAPVIYAVAYAALALTPTPATVTTITAGVLFGTATGIAVVMAGALAGAAAGFGLARALGRDTVRRVDSRRLQRVDAMLHGRGLVAVIGARLVPLLPFAAVNYACGLSALRTRDYLLGTAVGILPSVTAYVMIGAFGTSPGSVPFLIAVAGLVVFTGFGWVTLRRRGSPSRGRDGGVERPDRPAGEPLARASAG
jgi:uncharacterized membrane protein YdjX (TVP38/TMEM64 family)